MSDETETEEVVRKAKLLMSCVCKTEQLNIANATLDEYMRTSEFQDADRPLQFLTGMIHELEVEHDAGIKSIAADMWCGVKVEQWYAPEGQEKVSVYMECDRVEDGLVQILAWFNAGKPETAHEMKTRLETERCGPVEWKEVFETNKW